MATTILSAETAAVMLAAGQAIIEGAKNQASPKEPDVYNLTSELFPCICVAMYETILSPMVFEESLNEGEDEFRYNTVDWSDWKTELVKASQDYLDENVIDSLKNYGVLNIEACSIWSPKYYNFHQDELVMDVTMADDWHTIMEAKVREWQGRKDVTDYINNYWQSCSGFVSFMPKSLNEVLTEDDEDRQLAAYLTLAMVVEGTLRPYGDILEDLYYRMNDSFSDWESVNVLAEYMEEEDADDMLRLWDNDDDWNELYWDLFHKVGTPWRYDEDSKFLRGKKDCGYVWQANSEGKRLLFWAVQNNITVQDLRDMAA